MLVSLLATTNPHENEVTHVLYVFGSTWPALRGATRLLATMTDSAGKETEELKSEYGK